jgi:hypothetical protein
MSEEEKEAIELLKQPPDFSLSYYKREHAIDIVLNLIEKHQKEIEELKQDKKDNIQVVYGGRRFGTEGMVLKDYISKDKIIEKKNLYYKKLQENPQNVKDIQKYTFGILVLNELLEEK